MRSSTRVLRLEVSLQPQCVVRGVGFGVVIEVGVQIFSRTNLLFHPPAPAPQCWIRIAASIFLLRSVKADISDRPDGQARDIKPRQIVRAEGDATLLQQMEDLGSHPALIAKLEDMSQVLRQQVQKSFQSLKV